MADRILSAIQKIGGGLKNTRLRIEVEIDQTSQMPIIKLVPYLEKSALDYSKLINSVFDYAAEIAEKCRGRMLLVIDEAQHIMEWKRYGGLESIEGILKNNIEAANKRGVAVVLSGSRVHFWKEFLGKGTGPLFGLFTIIPVKELAKEHAKALFLTNADYSSEKAFEEAYRIVKGHPYYLLALATERKKNETINQCYRRLLKSQLGSLNLYVNYVLLETIGTSVQSTIASKILGALACGPLTPSEISSRINVPLTTLPQKEGLLVRLDLITKVGEKYKIVDRVVADYLKYNP